MEKAGFGTVVLGKEKGSWPSGPPLINPYASEELRESFSCSVVYLMQGIKLRTFIVFAALISCVSAQPGGRGPDVGATIPLFAAPDQNGVMQSLDRITGPKGAMIVFFRSADW